MKSYGSLIAFRTVYSLNFKFKNLEGFMCYTEKNELGSKSIYISLIIQKGHQNIMLYFKLTFLNHPVMMSLKVLVNKAS